LSKENRPYTVYIAADIEGITGYVAWPEKPPEELWYREQMTGEVNAAIEGALAAGAEKVIVSDIHWTKQNILPEKLRSEASLIRGSKRQLMWMEAIDQSRLVLLVGFHAGCGSAGAVLPHTVDTRISRLKINGKDANEALLTAMTAGYFNVPVGLITGDKAVVEETKQVLVGVEHVTVKEALGSFAAISIHPDLVKSKIRDAAERAVRREMKGELSPLIPPNPSTCSLEFIFPCYADALQLVPGVKRLSGREVTFSGDWIDILRVISFFVNWVIEVTGLF